MNLGKYQSELNNTKCKVAQLELQLTQAKSDLQEK